VRFIKFALIAALAFALDGCAATSQQVAQNLGEQYVGKNVDAMTSRFGPPQSAFRMNSGETAYVWQLSAVTNYDIGQYGGSAKTNYCKVNVIASPAGVVTKLTTEDAVVNDGLLRGLEVWGSVCAQHLGMARQ
jgi:hypothetical protein